MAPPKYGLGGPFLDFLRKQFTEEPAERFLRSRFFRREAPEHYLQVISVPSGQKTRKDRASSVRLILILQEEANFADLRRTSSKSGEGRPSPKFWKGLAGLSGMPKRTRNLGQIGVRDGRLKWTIFRFVCCYTGGPYVPSKMDTMYSLLMHRFLRVVTPFWRGQAA